MFERWREFLKKHQGTPEESVSYRVAVTVLVMYAVVLTLHQLEWPGFSLAMILITPAASWLSYHRRASSNVGIKIFLSFAMVAVLLWFFVRLRQNTNDPRIPLAELLLWLQTLHAFDLPAKKDLRYTGVVALILMAIACVLTYSSYFAIFLLGFFVLFCLTGVLDFWSDNRHGDIRVTESTPGRGPDRSWLGKSVGQTLPLALLGAVIVFVFMPRYQGLTLRTFPMSWDISFQLAQVSDGAIVNQNLPSNLDQSRGRPQRVDGDSYFGFDSQVNLNTRGRLSDRVIMKVRTSHWQYHRGVTFDEYTGFGWKSELGEPQLSRVKSPPHYFPYHGGDDQRLTIYYAEVDLPNIIFTPPSPRRLYFPSNEIFKLNSFYRPEPQRRGRKRERPDGRVAQVVNSPAHLISPFNLEEGVVYSVINQLPEIPVSELKALSQVPTEGRLAHQLEPYLQLPDALPPRVGELARELVAGSDSPWTQASRLTSYLQQNYRYNLEVDFYPEGVDAVDHFLFEAREGYCEQFASALCVMARSVGLPARYVTGYLPGQYNPISGFYEIKANDAHAWAEIYIPDYGWMVFDPVPGENATPELSESRRQKWMLESLLEYLKVPRVIRDNIGPLLRVFVGLALASLVFALWRERRGPAPDPSSLLAPYLLKAEALTSSRRSGETVRNWAQRVNPEKLAPLAQVYEESFYRDRVPGPDELSRLDQLLRELRAENGRPRS